MEAIIEELLLHHKFLCRSCVKKSKQGKKTWQAKIGGFGHVRREKDHHMPKGQLEAQIAVGVDWGESQPSQQKFFLVLVTLWSPDLSTREHRHKEVTT